MIAASLTETSVLTSERKRTSRGATGATLSRAAHQMDAVRPGARVASMVVCPPLEARLVITPGPRWTLVRSPGIASVSRTEPAAGVDRANAALPASMRSGRPARSVTENSPGGRTACVDEAACSSGRSLPWRCASKIVMPETSGTEIGDLPKTSPSRSKVPETDSLPAWSFSTALFSA